MAMDILLELQRLKHWQGQMLRSLDLNDQNFFNSHLRAWHNRAQHEAYGISEGLQVSIADTGRAVNISSGLAYDIHGRELILADEKVVQIPDAEIPEAGLLLVMGCCADGRIEPRHKLTEACLPGVPSDSSNLIINWQHARSFSPYEGVALALLSSDNGLELDPGFTPRRSRSRSRPLIAHSATLPGNTAWRLWHRDIAAGSSGAKILGLELEIDTAAAGFTRTPCYFAWLQGELWNPEELGSLSKGKTKVFGNTLALRRVLDGLVLLQLLHMQFGHIYSPTIDGFVYRLWMPQIAKWSHTGSIFQYVLSLARKGNLSLAWLGIQMDAHHFCAL